MIPENEQWKLNGECNKCRKNSYCRSECSKAKQRTHALMWNAIRSSPMFRALYRTGAYNSFIKESDYFNDDTM